MIPKHSRFTQRLFDRAFRRSRRIHVGDCTFLISDTPQQSHFSVVVGKKTSKLAVQRNRLRRQMYEMIRTNLIPYAKGKNVICLYRGSKVIENSNTFRVTLVQLLQKLLPHKKNYGKNKRIR
jgi:ribonuclease P protein component